VGSAPVAFLCASSSSCVRARSKARLSTGSNLRGGGDESPRSALFHMRDEVSSDCFATQQLHRRQAVNTSSTCGTETHAIRTRDISSCLRIPDHHNV
jgi:hypothetical protein